MNEENSALKLVDVIILYMMHGRKNIKKEGNKIMKILKCFSYNLNNDLRTYFKTCPVNNFVPLTYFELLMYEFFFL